MSLSLVPSGLKSEKFEPDVNTLYLEEVFEPGKYKKTVKRVTALARKIRAIPGRDFDSIAFSGISGASIGFPVAAALGVPVIYIRKECDSSHFGKGCIEGVLNSKKYLIIDDFIASGKTVAYIAAVIGKNIDLYPNVYLNLYPQCVGVLQYNSSAVVGRKTYYELEFDCFAAPSIEKYDCMQDGWQKEMRKTLLRPPPPAQRITASIKRKLGIY